jgi:hypothetical protein
VRKINPTKALDPFVGVTKGGEGENRQKQGTKG